MTGRTETAGPARTGVRRAGGETVIETPRLRLREMTPADLDEVASMLAHPEVMRFYPKCLSAEESEIWLHRQIARYAEHGHGFWLVEERASGRAAGQAGVIRTRVRGGLEHALGWLLHRPFWGRGYATEAAAACRDHALGALELPRVITLVRPENVASLRVAERIGMKPEGVALYGGYEHLVFARSRG